MFRFVLPLILISLLAVPAHAALLTDYGPPVIEETIPDSADAMTDIKAIYVAQDADNWYFRMDLFAAPQGSLSYDEFAIYIDADNNAGTGAMGSAPGLYYVPNNISGIENIIDVHWLNNHGWDAKHWHTWTGGVNFTLTTDLQVQTTENGGTTLEMKLDKSYLPVDSFTVYGGIQLTAIDPFTADTTAAGSVVPEPTSWVLLAGLAGCAVLLLFRRS